MSMDVSDYVWVENPKTVFVVEWTGDNWAEMVEFLRRFTRRWDFESYSTDEKSVIIKGAESGDLILERWDHLLVEASGRKGKIVSELDLISDYTKGRSSCQH